ncbi:hypothetical protein VNI00_018037 [Paramarasmius palmivorus]|uniref:Ribonuclease H1 N-terminal domain-containing protein n=1 Tax=Paramarasmius palmivorus TaxID=297713 RepID=A0AAW0B2Q9_9AGAR
MSEPRRPSKVDRRTGTHIIPSNPYRSTPPVDSPGHAPDTYTLTQHNPDKGAILFLRPLATNLIPSQLGITISRTTIEDPNGWLVTTTVTIYRRHPDAPRPSNIVEGTYVTRGTSPGLQVPNDIDQTIEAGTSAPEESMDHADQVNDTTPSPFTGVFATLPAPPPPTFNWSAIIPHPNQLVVRPGMDMAKAYVIFRGREVGIFYNYPAEVQPRTHRVSNAALKVFDSFQEAVAAYTEAYNGDLPGYELAVIHDPVVISAPPANSIVHDPMVISAPAAAPVVLSEGSAGSLNIVIDSDSDEEAEVEQQIEYK